MEADSRPLGDKVLYQQQEEATEKLVASHYDEYPYPEFKTTEETKREQVPFVLGCNVNFISHHCYNGQQTFDGFAFLDAGCGTGTGITCFASGLQFISRATKTATNCRVIGIDISTESLRLAKCRSGAHCVDRIVELRQMSILDIPASDLPAFDYITCTGVLHHMENPLNGLRALSSRLKPNGFMYLMLYAKYSRLAIDVAQRLLQLLTAKEATEDGHELTRQEKVAITKQFLKSIPPTHMFDQIAKKMPIMTSDTELFDLLLHEKNYMLSTSEMFDLIDKTDLEFVKYVNFHYLYKPEAIFTGDALARVLRLPKRKQYEACELMWSGIPNHIVLLKKRATIPALASALASALTPTSAVPFPLTTDVLMSTNFIPVFVDDGREHLLRIFSQYRNMTIMANIGSDTVRIMTKISNHIARFVHMTDGERSTFDIIATGAKEFMITKEVYIGQILPFLNIVVEYYMLMLQRADFKFVINRDW